MPYKKLTIVINSCDKYEDCWELLFTTIKDRWKDCPYDIVLNTESKEFHMDGLNIKCFTMYKPNQTVKWGKRFIDTLKKIDTDYVLCLLDDFFLTADVDQHRIEECIEWMENNKNIITFNFWRTRKDNIKDGKYLHFEKRKQKAEYKLNCQAAIWRRKKLIKYIKPFEDPWEWEVIGSKRATRYFGDFYNAVENEPYVMEYIRGGGIWRGKWYKPEMDKLLKRYPSIELNMDERGYYNSLEEYQHRNDVELDNTSKNIIVRVIQYIYKKIALIRHYL